MIDDSKQNKQIKETKQTDKSIRQQTSVKAESAVWQVSEYISCMLQMQACVLLNTACFWAWLRQLPIHCILATTVIFWSFVQQTVILTAIVGVANAPGNHRHGAENEPPVTWISQRGEEMETPIVISHFSRQGWAELSTKYLRGFCYKQISKVVSPCGCQSGPHR